MGGGSQWMMVVLLILTFVSQTWSFCPQYCHCDDTSLKVDCDSTSKLMVVPIVLNPRIKGLSLSHNQIKDITMSFQFYGELTNLDISRNLIGSLGTLNFESLRQLQVLNLSYNSVKAVENGAFQGLPSLLTLDLSGNQIERMEREIFWGLKDIREINLDRNRLEFVDWELFRGLDYLERISIQFNFIQVIEPSANLVPGGTPWTFKSLTSLDMSSNQLTRVKNSSLEVFSALTDLNLCCNYIHTLERNAFSGLSQLREANLSQNRISRIPTQVLDKVSTSLRILDLSSNRISESPIEKGSFGGLFSLEHLLLSDNPGVTGIHSEAFEDLINLSEFEGDYLTNLTELDGNLLNNKPNLQRFSLRYAQIFRIPEDLLTTQVPAGALDLTGNPIHCNCSAWALFQYLSEHSDEMEEEIIPLGVTLPHNFSQAQYVDPRKPSRPKRPFYLSSVRCQNPPELSGILVKDLKSSDFSSCFTKDDDFQLLVIIIAASILVLIMLVVGLKLCCLGQSCSRCRKMCHKLGKLPCCRRRPQKDVNDAGQNEQFFTRDLPPPPKYKTEFVGANGGKLFFSTENTNSPIHANNSQQLSQQLFYNYLTSARKDFMNGGSGPTITEGDYQIVSNPLVNNYNTSNGSGGTHSSKRNNNHPNYSYSNYHPDDDGENDHHYFESTFSSNPMLFRHNYENYSHPRGHGHTNGGGEMFLDYNKHKNNKKSHHTLSGSGSGGYHQRQEQGPSVLV